MTLATHAVAGAFLGAVAAQNPAFAALLGFSSHFLLDSIPHWDYHLASAQENKTDEMQNDIAVNNPAFMTDLFKIGLDVLIGLIIILFLFNNASRVVLAGALIGAFFAMLPDPLQFVYMKWRHEPLISLQKFHLYLHAKLHLKDRPVLGVLSQLILITIIAILAHSLII